MTLQLFNADCFDILPTIEDKSIDLIFCDLPYGQTNCKWDTPIDLEKMWEQFKRIRKDTTPIIFTTTTKFGHRLLESNFTEFKLDMVWLKSKKSGFLHAKKRPLGTHEMLYFFWKKQPTYNYLKYHKKLDKEAKEYKRKSSPLYADKIVKGNSNSKPLYEPALPSSVLEIKSKKATKHQTSKPLELMEFILKYWTNEGDKVLDITMGGGSMGKVAKNMNRVFIGVEKDKDIFNMANKYINE